jgi:hypothetical protein
MDVLGSEASPKKTEIKRNISMQKSLKFDSPLQIQPSKPVSKDKVHVAFMFASPFSYPMGISSVSKMKLHAELFELGFKDEAKRIKNKAKES